MLCDEAARKAGGKPRSSGLMRGGWESWGDDNCSLQLPLFPSAFSSNRKIDAVEVARKSQEMAGSLVDGQIGSEIETKDRPSTRWQ